MTGFLSFELELFLDGFLISPTVGIGFMSIILFQIIYGIWSKILVIRKIEGKQELVPLSPDLYWWCDENITENCTLNDSSNSSVTDEISKDKEHEKCQSSAFNETEEQEELEDIILNFSFSPLQVKRNQNICTSLPNSPKPVNHIVKGSSSPLLHELEKSKCDIFDNLNDDLQQLQKEIKALRKELNIYSSNCHRIASDIESFSETFHLKNLIYSIQQLKSIYLSQNRTKEFDGVLNLILQKYSCCQEKPKFFVHDYDFNNNRWNLDFDL